MAVSGQDVTTAVLGVTGFIGGLWIFCELVRAIALDIREKVKARRAALSEKEAEQ